MRKLDRWTLDLFQPRASSKSAEISVERRSPRPLRSSDKYDLDEIESLARGLMRSLGQDLVGNGLADLGWAFRFDRAKTRLGCCTWSTSDGTKELSLSRHYAEMYGWKIMEDVARHEIAHALDVETRGRTDHGRAWKRWARKCGADPARLYEGDEVKAIKPKFLGVCPACGTEYPYYRRPKRAVACAGCCKRFNRGRYSEQFRIVLYETDEFTGTQLGLFSGKRG
ncbi:MAG: SprT-like domain-containing protein [Bacteroidetes bacterium]|nr:SprT-like domain-containing protein [Bacteroidota bacterium]